MAMLLGFSLLFLLLLGGGLFLLSLIFVAIGVGMQLFSALASSNVPWVPPLAMGIQLAATTAFALGVVLIVVGLTAFLFPAVRAFLNGLRILFRLALDSQLMVDLPVWLRAAAAALRAGGVLLCGPAEGPTTGSATDMLNQAQARLHDAGNAVPSVPTVSHNHEQFFLETSTDQYGGVHRVHGFVPRPPAVSGIPDIDIVTSVTIGSADVSPFANALNYSGDRVAELKGSVEGTGKVLHETANALDEIAGLVEQSTT